jgi:molybdate transport system permease protein
MGPWPWHPLLLSLSVAAAATFLALSVGGGGGVLLSRRRFVGRELVDALLCLPLTLPPTVLGYYLLVVLGRLSPLGRLWEAVLGQPLTFTPAAAVVAAMVHGVPSLIKASRAALEDVDPLLLRAAASLGASELRRTLTVALPVARRPIVAAAMLAFARALGDFGVTLMIAGDIPGYTQTASLAIYDAVQAGRQGQALGLVATLSAIALVILYVTNRLSTRAQDTPEVRKAAGRDPAPAPPAPPPLPPLDDRR